MTGPSVRLLTEDGERRDAALLVSSTMLGSTRREVTDQWAAHFGDRTTHGAHSAAGELVGVAQWFRSDMSMSGPSLPAACVTAVAVLSTHRRQGHLSRLMREQIDSIAAADVPIALLVAAEWPIYGRFGYGPAIFACGWQVDAGTARFRDGPTGTVELVGPEALRPHLEAVHDLRWGRTTGAVKRDGHVWDHLSGLRQWPHEKEDLGQRRGALWRDEEGEVRGAVAFAVEEQWVHNRPQGKVEVKLLVGATPEAERELWRHLVDTDWITTVSAGLRPVDDPLPLWLSDGRAAFALDHSDSIWARVLDVARVLGARRRALPGGAVIEVVDDLGLASGRWSVDLGPDGADVVPTGAAPDVRLPVSSLGAAVLGGTGVVHLHQAGLVDEERPGGVARLHALLASSEAPWSPTSY